MVQLNLGGCKNPISTEEACIIDFNKDPFAITITPTEWRLGDSVTIQAKLKWDACSALPNQTFPAVQWPMDSVVFFNVLFAAEDSICFRFLAKFEPKKENRELFKVSAEFYDKNRSKWMEISESIPITQHRAGIYSLARNQKKVLAELIHYPESAGHQTIKIDY